MEARLKHAATWLKQHSDPLVFAAFMALCLLLFLRSWIAEDAYITFRVVDNFLHGYGLRWNILERVQAYTHPLWMLLHIPAMAIIGNAFHASIALCLLCSIAALWLVLAHDKRGSAFVLFVFLLPLALSKSFMDYSSSGLETPLSFLLFAAFGHKLITRDEQRHSLFWLTLIASLAVLNRMDSLLIYAPTLALLTHKKIKQSIPQLVAGSIPLIVWFSFSLLYYGFLFPNTKYAKLDTGISTLLYIAQGLDYAYHQLLYDAPSVLIILAGLWLAFKRGSMAASLAIGVCLYVAYTIFIGGDYMVGRFYALPVFICAWLIYQFAPANITSDRLFAALVMLFVAKACSLAFISIHKECPTCLTGESRIIDATHIFETNKLFASYWPVSMRHEGNYIFAFDGIKNAQDTENRIKKADFVGMAGFYSGPEVTYIDTLGLADPLLARLPAIDTGKLYPGHFKRDIPKGYMYALRTGSTERMDAYLADYYTALRRITAGELLDKERIKTIIKFNSGYYDGLKAAYVNSYTQ